MEGQEENSAERRIDAGPLLPDAKKPEVGAFIGATPIAVAENGRREASSEVGMDRAGFQPGVVSPLFLARSRLRVLLANSCAVKPPRAGRPSPSKPLLRLVADVTDGREPAYRESPGRQARGTRSALVIPDSQASLTAGELTCLRSQA